ncbi:MAG: outer membrane lipoprotein-sorting protein, partial [Treponemataceae bacterium]
MSINFKRCRAAVSAIALSLVAAAVFAVPTAEELLVSLDKSQTFDSSFANAMMTIVDKFGTRKTEFKVWSRGKDDTFMEFTSAAERGQKILRNAKELYLFFPDAEEVTRLQGSALRQSMAGSDISYEDMTGTRNRAQNYHATLVGTEQLGGKTAYRLDLRAKTRNVAYARQEAWLDASNYLPVQVKFYDLSGKVLKDMTFFDVRVIEGFPVNTRFLVKDALKAGTSTEMAFREMTINKPLPAGIFS